MKDNLARKPRLVLVEEAGRLASPGVEALAPELDTQPAQPEKNTFRWLTSLLIVLITYGAPLAWWLMPEESSGPNTPPPAAMVVELAPAPVAPPTPTEQAPGPELAEAIPPEPEPQLEPLPEPEIPPAPPVVKPDVPVKPEPEPKPETQQMPKELPLPEESEVVPPEEKPSSTASALPDAPREDLDAAAPNQGVSVPAVNSNAIPTWQNSLMLKLNEAKRYPARARRYRQEGIAYLRFTMDREGKVLAKSIEQSAGYPLLDEETLALIDRAQPLPKPPAEMQGEALEFVVPVEFFLNR
ncbi:MAG: energy transducer TonB [Porticoccus sp.]|nr:MAG: energy transducer TonB [Porticoccus sp.]